MHLRRILSALVLAPAFLLLVQFGSPHAFSLLVAAAILLGAVEVSRLCPAGSARWAMLLTVAGASGWHLAALRPEGVVPFSAGLVAAALIGALAWGADAREASTQAAWVLLGSIYVGGMMGAASLLRAEADGRALIYLAVGITWAGDVGAFYAGSRWGRHLLAPRISPKKSWEGVAGGLAASVAVAALGSVWVWPRVPAGSAAGLGLLLGGVGIVGDLVESALKRAAGVKDSGGLIPGHGGILDRVDSLMFIIPCLYGLVRLGWV